MSGVYEQTEKQTLASIRLCGQERAVEHCATLALVTTHRAAPAFEADIVSTWRDVPGQDAGRSSGIGLELRRENGTLIQTIHGAAPDGEPLDISFDLGGDKISGLPRMRTSLQLEPLSGAETGKEGKTGTADTLSRRTRLRLRTELKRRVVPLRYQSSEMTITMERGRVFAWPEDGRFLSQRVGQVVLELVSGNMDDLHAFGVALAAKTGLSPADRAPEDIGRALLREDLGDPMKAPRYGLDEDATAADVLEKALHSAATHIMGNIPAVRNGNDAGIKQMRIGLRRLRSILRVFAKGLPRDDAEAFNTQARDFGKVLGRTRDLDVFAGETLPAIIAAGVPGETEAEALAALARQAERLRQQERRAAIRLVDDPAFAAFCMRLHALIETAPWRETAVLARPARKFAATALDKALARVEKSGKDIDDAPPSARHPMRVELKKLRYAVQAFRPLYPKAVRKPYLSGLSALQDEFGVLNDAVVARDVVIMVAHSDDGTEDVRALEAGAGYVVGWTRRGLEDHGNAVVQKWRDLSARKPFWRKG